MIRNERAVYHFHDMYVCYQDEGQDMTWKRFEDEDKARESYDSYEEKKARMLCKNEKVVNKDGLEKMTDEMKKYAEKNHKLTKVQDIYHMVNNYHKDSLI